MTDLEKWLCAAIRAEKAVARVTNLQLSERTGIPEVSVQRYLSGKRPINTETLEMFADALGVRASYLMTEAERRRDDDASLDLDYDPSLDAVARDTETESTDEQ